MHRVSHPYTFQAPCIQLIGFSTVIIGLFPPRSRLDQHHIGSLIRVTDTPDCIRLGSSLYVTIRPS